MDGAEFPGESTRRTPGAPPDGRADLPRRSWRRTGDLKGGLKQGMAFLPCREGACSAVNGAVLSALSLPSAPTGAHRAPTRAAHRPSGYNQLHNIANACAACTQGGRIWNFGGPCDSRRLHSSPLEGGRSGGGCPGGWAARTGIFPTPLIRELPGSASVPPASREARTRKRAFGPPCRRDAGAPEGGTPLPTSPLKGGRRENGGVALHNPYADLPHMDPPSLGADSRGAPL